MIATFYEKVLSSQLFINVGYYFYTHMAEVK